MSKLEKKLTSGQRVITAEITPPKGAGIKKLLSHAKLISPYVDAINLTDCQRALVKMSSLAAARILIDGGFEPVYQLTCRDRNSIALQSDLMGAHALGVQNLLCLTGDPVKVGDSRNSKSVFELEAVGLIELVQKLQGGRDNSGQKMNAPTKFFVGAVVNPNVQSRESQLLRMQKKVRAGARFFQTQANYDISGFQSFLDQAKPLGVPIIAGVLVLSSYELASYIRENIPGIDVPQDLLERFKHSSDSISTGIDFAVETMLSLESRCQGFHVMTVREEELIPKVMERYYAKRQTQENPSSPLPSSARC